MEDESIMIKRIRDEISDSINPLYVLGLLKKSIPELCMWIQRSYVDHEQTRQETIRLAERYEATGEAGALELGIRILETNQKLILFVLKEIRQRLTAADIKLS